MMVTRGFGEKQGLKLDIMQIKADQIGLKALLAGELDSYEGGPGGAIVAAARGADVKILGCLEHLGRLVQTERLQIGFGVGAAVAASRT